MRLVASWLAPSTQKLGQAVDGATVAVG